MSNQTLMHTDFAFKGQRSVYRGKVREVYTIDKDLLVMVATDRLSAFDVVMPKGIPFKGQILNQIATRMLNATANLVPNWLIGSPDPNVTIGKACEPIKIEMVIRGYLAGHSAREYALGKRELCGVKLVEELKENDPFETPIITPATKADQGEHDEDISVDGILERGIVSEADYALLEKYTRLLFEKGSEMARASNLILVDTKYEFGRTKDGEIVLIDEVHTPDSSRYFYADTYDELQQQGLPQRQLSKEFVRRWLIDQGFQGKSGQLIPKMSDSYIEGVSKRYIELYEAILQEPFVKADTSSIRERIEDNVDRLLSQM